MAETIVRCTHPGCSASAQYKIAAMWSDGRFRELKTYGQSCVDHLGDNFHEAEGRWDITTRVSGEIIEEVGIYRFKSGLRDAFLERLWGLEESYRATSER